MLPAPAPSSTCCPIPIHSNGSTHKTPSETTQKARLHRMGVCTWRYFLCLEAMGTLGRRPHLWVASPSSQTCPACLLYLLGHRLMKHLLHLRLKEKKSHVRASAPLTLLSLPNNHDTHSCPFRLSTFDFRLSTYVSVPTMQSCSRKSVLWPSDAPRREDAKSLFSLPVPPSTLICWHP